MSQKDYVFNYIVAYIIMIYPFWIEISNHTIHIYVSNTTLQAAIPVAQKKAQRVLFSWCSAAPYMIARTFIYVFHDLNVPIDSMALRICSGKQEVIGSEIGVSISFINLSVSRRVIPFWRPKYSKSRYSSFPD